MVNRKSGVIIAAIVALFSFVSMVYVSSCTKPANGINCDGVVCQNGGYCLTDSVGTKLVASCVCPTGFEGSNCGTAIVSKYLGTWKVLQKVIGSDSAKAVGTDTTYQVQLIATPTPTTFMIYDLCGDQNYNDIVCSIDSTNSNMFLIDSQSAFHMIFDHFKLTQNAVGTLYPGSAITATLCVKHLDNNVNWQYDTLALILTPAQN